MYSKESILEAAKALGEAFQSLDTIQDYRRIETQIHQNEQIAQHMSELKQNQKQSVNLQNYNKPNAYARSEAKIDQIRTTIDDIPIVNEFRTAQQEANELLHLVVDTISTRIESSTDD
ncbi:RicAFT regulatory complex protein RicA family protein [Staphylococcus coagulans]|uniref:RicAFT regulatory complex protein RicA family protein n=1 Tax=Staphylococcus coagulans TaxID=74706 RepID=UPI0015F7E3F7|nr:YlbF family regulator [Staphylococcus coagulans]MBA8759151.1 hypothetical protein [Staphylococcus coagulans]MBA8761495.1 hypothetical protein [Staphylococcus coagulans]MBA8768070.1 hypothetical protein [Staphylococcus coagulans]